MKNGREVSWIAALALAITTALVFTIVGCGGNRNKNLGTEKNPVVLAFMPTVQKEEMPRHADILAKSLEDLSGYQVKPLIAKDYLSIIDGLAEKKIDAAFLNSLGYLLARDWGKARAILQLKGADGQMNYKSAIIAGSASGIKKIEDISGKRFAFTDPYSLAGYLMPLLMFTEKGVKPVETFFAGGYDEVVDMVYNGKADAGAIFYHERDPYGRIRDARERLIPKYNDMLDKVLIVETSGPIPNTPVVFRRGLPEDVEKLLETAFIKMGSDTEAVAAVGRLYDATGFEPSEDENFDKIRYILKKLGKDVKETVPGAVTFFRKHFWDSTPER